MHRHDKQQMTSILKKIPLGNFTLKECGVGGKRSRVHGHLLKGTLLKQRIGPTSKVPQTVSFIDPSPKLITSSGYISLCISYTHPHVIICRYVFN